ncbi:MAG: hypothetical protein ACM3NH_01640 [Candidatus Saccharibacteria bacterium]
MKRSIGAAFLSVIVSAMFAPVQALAQDPEPKGFRITSVTVSSGEDAISSGLTGVIQFGDEKGRTVEVAVQQEQAWVIYGPKLKFGRAEVYAGGSAGHFQGSPWIGPYLSASVPVGTIAGQRVSLSTLHWPCVFLGKEPRNWMFVHDGKPENGQSVFIGYVMSYGASLGPLGFSYARLYFLDDPVNQIPGISYTHKVRKDIRITGSASRNWNSKSWMYYVGVNWNRQ